MRNLSSISLPLILGIVVILVGQSLIWWAHYYVLADIEDAFGWSENSPVPGWWVYLRMLVIVLLGWYGGWNVYLSVDGRTNVADKPKFGWLIWFVIAVVCAWISALITSRLLP